MVAVVIASGASIAYLFRKEPYWDKLTIFAMLTGFILITIFFVIRGHMILVRGDPESPLPMAVMGRGGSLALWVWGTYLCYFWVRRRYREDDLPLLRYTPAVLNLASLVIIYFLVFYYDPYGIRTLCPCCLAYTSLLLAHPLTLFASRSLMLVAFAGYIGFLITEDRRWDEFTYPFLMASYLFLTLGIIIGGIWIYKISVTHWGAPDPIYWAWDPIETAPLVPWVVWTVCIHTRRLMEKDENMETITIMLGIIGCILLAFSYFILEILVMPWTR